MTELAEGARLEIVCSAKSGTVGSNPTLSARKFLWNADERRFSELKNSKEKIQETESEGFAYRFCLLIYSNC